MHLVIKVSSYLHSPRFKHQISSPLTNLIISDYLVNKLLQTIVGIIAVIFRKCGTQLTGGSTNGQRYSPLERDVDYCFLLEEDVYSKFHGSYEINEVEDAVCKTES